jgi:DNA-binding transcriptional ArsR family regulator
MATPAPKPPPEPKPKPPPAPKPPPEPVISERDLELLRALAEQRIAVMVQVAYWLGVGERTAGRRVARLRAAGLVESRRLFDRGSAMVRITAPGLKLVGSPLGRPGQKLDEYRHDVGVGWVWTAAREGAFGDMAAIHSERAMRSHDASLERMSPGERLSEPDGELRGVGVGAWRPDGRPERHYPDLLLETHGGHRIAVELELSSKGRQRLDRVMEAYASDARIDAVLYLVPDARLGDQIQEAAARAGITDTVHVRRIAGGEIGGVSHTHTHTRAPSRDQAHTRPSAQRETRTPREVGR